MVLAVSKRMKGRCADWTGCGGGVWCPRGNLLLERCQIKTKPHANTPHTVRVCFEMKPEDEVGHEGPGA
jgi:hypothetical protein